MAKAKNKTQATKFSVDAFIASRKDEQVRDDCHALVKMMTRITRCEPKMWGTSIVGFGDFHYKYASGREGDWFRTGFSPRKANLTIYSMCGYQHFPELIKKLGKHKINGGCLYIKRLGDVDAKVLGELIARAMKMTAEMAEK